MLLHRVQWSMCSCTINFLYQERTAVLCRCSVSGHRHEPFDLCVLSQSWAQRLILVPFFTQFIIPSHSSLYTAALRESKVIIDGRWLFHHSVCGVSRVTCRGAPLLLRFSMVVMALLLLRGGDVESNPGPGESP